MWEIPLPDVTKYRLRGEKGQCMEVVLVVQMELALRKERGQCLGLEVIPAIKTMPLL